MSTSSRLLAARVLGALALTAQAIAPPAVSLSAPATPPAHTLTAAVVLPADRSTIGVYGYQFDPVLDGPPNLPASLRAVESADQPGLHLIQFAGPIQDSWRVSAEASGLKLLQYYAHYSYLAWGTPAQRAQAAQNAAVRWAGPFQPGYKINPSLYQVSGKVQNAVITFYAVDRAATLKTLTALGGRYVQDFPAQPDEAFYSAVYEIDADRLSAVAQMPEVWAVDFVSPQPAKDDELGAQIIAGNYLSPTRIPTGYYNWLANTGITGQGVTWAVVDTGLDSTHPDIAPSRIVTFVTYPGSASAATDPDGHGTHVAGAVMGDGRNGAGITDANGFYYGTGMAVSSTLIVQNALMGSSWPPVGGWQLLSKDTVTHGGVGSSNSWFTGASGAQGYSAAARTHDLMVRDANFDTVSVAEPIVMVFSAGNAGPSASTMTEPKEAKNLITVGASDNFSRTGTTINGLGSFSSRGPALDGRLLPNVTAPGVSTASMRTSAAGASSCATAISGTSGYYALCTGTSMAAPFVSGASALLVQWWRQNNAGATPSPAMVKALLINGAVDMAGGTNVGGNIPNNNQGWGRVNVNNVISAGVPALYFDQNFLFTDSGQSMSLPPLLRADPAKPVKISLVWSDAAGGIGANPALVNNLNLTADVNGTLYRGNVFSAGWSTTGGSADALNNIENIYLQNPSGTINIMVTAANIAGDGVPYNGDSTDQDFALVVHNVIYAEGIGALTGQVTNAATSAPIAGALVQASASPTQTFATTTDSGGTYTLTALAGFYTVTASATDYVSQTLTALEIISGVTTTQNFALTGIPFLTVNGHTLAQVNGNSDGVIDPGEIWSVLVPLTNTGNLTATGVTGVLSLTAGLGTVLQPTSAYPDLGLGAGANNLTPFVFQVGLTQTCGQPLSLNFVAAASNAASAAYGFGAPVGQTTLGPTTTYTSTHAPIPIPDNNPTGITALLTITAPGVVGDIDVRLNNVTHTYVGDLIMRLGAPSGSVTTTLMQRPGGGGFGSSGDNFINTILDDSASTSIQSIGAIGPFTGRWSPFQPLSVMNGQPISGAWRLNVSDNFSFDVGTLNQWSLDIRELLHVCNPHINYAFTLSPAASAGAGNPGTAVEHTFTVTNTGSLTDTYALTVTGAGWPTSAPASVEPVAPGSSASVLVTVTVPLTASAGASTALTLTVTSDGDTSVSASASLTTAANQAAGLQVTLPVTAHAALAGSQVTYTAMLTNTGNGPDTFTVTVSGNAYTVTHPLTVGPLNPGSMSAVELVVDIPPGALPGDSDAATVTFTSHVHPAMQVTHHLITTVDAVTYRLYLPLVMR